MLHLTLGAAMFAGATTSPSAVDAYLAYIPAECPVVIQFGDIGAMFERPADERGSWESFLFDERVLGAIRAEMVEEGMPEEAAEVGSALLETIRGGAVGLDTAAFEIGPAEFVAVLDADDGFTDLLREMIELSDGIVIESEIDGQPAIIFPNDDEDFAATFLDVGDHMLVTLGTQSTAADTLRAMVARASSNEDEPWWSALDGRVPGAMVEVMMNFGTLADVDPDLAEAAEYVETLYAGIGFGSRNRSDGLMQVNLVENEVIAELAERLGTPSEDLFYLAPEGAMTVQAIHLDVLGMVESVVALMDEFEPEAGAGEGYDAAVEAMGGALGIDLEEDILSNFTGDMFMVQWPVEEIDVEEPTSFAALIPVLGLEFSDPEPFLELIESAEPFLEGIGQIIEEDDSTSLDLAIPGMTLSVTVTDDTLYVGDTDRLEEVRGRRGVKAEGGAFDAEVIEEAIAAFGSGGMGIWDMAAAMDLVWMSLEVDGMDEMPEEGLAVLDAFAEHIGGAGFNTFEMSARSVTIKLGTR